MLYDLLRNWCYPFHQMYTIAEGLFPLMNRFITNQETMIQLTNYNTKLSAVEQPFLIESDEVLFLNL